MEKKIPNKRKSLATSNATPNKIRKTDTPASQNIVNKPANKNGNKSKLPNKNQNISPKKQVNGNQAKENKNEQLEIVLNKSANKIKENQTNGKKTKSPSKNQNMTPNKQMNGKQTTPKKQMNAKQITPKKQVNAKQTTPKKQVNAKQTTPKKNKKSKQVEEDEVELIKDSEEYDTDKSIEEMHDSDLEEEVDSDEDAQVNEDESDNEAHVDEDEAQVKEEESDDEAQVDENESGDEAQVDEVDEVDSDEEENDDDELENDEVGDSDGEEEDEEIDEENNDEADKKLSVFLEGLKPALTMDRIFPGCNIKTFNRWKNLRSKENSDCAEVFFKDIQSLKKALEKEKFNVGRIIIRVRINNKTQEFGVFVANLPPDTNVRDLFNDCNILWDSLNKFVYFEDKESMQRALLKNGSEVNGKSITVIVHNEIAKNLKNLTVYIKNLNSDIRIEDIFEGCSIKFYIPRTDTTTNKLNGDVDVIFEDEESVQKALLKHNTEYNGSVIKMYRKQCCVIVKGIQENTKIEKILTGCKIHDVALKMNEDTNELRGAAVHFQDYLSLKRAFSLKTPPGIQVVPPGMSNYLFKNKSGFIKNKFNKPPPYQRSRGNEAKKLLLQELKSQVQKLSEEVYGTSRPRPRPFMSARRNPRINN